MAPDICGEERKSFDLFGSKQTMRGGGEREYNLSYKIWRRDCLIDDAESKAQTPIWIYRRQYLMEEGRN
jgi:hypothetical protein